MHYIDPYELFQLNVQAPSEVTKEVLKRARQKILAEFELSDDIVIKKAGAELDKATALQLLEELENPIKRSHHWHLHANPQLKDFLREEKLRYLRYLPEAENLGDAEFRKFLSEQLAPIYDRHLSENIRKGRRPEVSLILQRLDLITDWDMDVALKGAIRYFNQYAQEISQLVDRPEELRQARVDHLFELEQIKLLNRFPRVYQHVRNRYAESLRKLAETYENKLDQTHTAYAVICVAAELDTDLSTAEYINYLKVELWRRKRQKDQSRWTRTESKESEPKSNYAEQSYQQQNTQRTEEPHVGRRNRWWIAVFLIIGAVSLLRLCDRPRRSHSFDIDSITKIDIPEIDIPSIELGVDPLTRSLNAQDYLFDSLADFEAYATDIYIAGDNGEGIDDVKIRPDTTSPYHDEIFGFDLTWFGVPRIQFRNRSDFDAVVFLVDEAEGKIKYHYFVSAGETAEWREVPENSMGVKLYLGKYWSPVVMSYFDDRMGAFAHPHYMTKEGVETINDGMTYFKTKKDEGFEVDNKRIGKVMTLSSDLKLSLETK